MLGHPPRILVSNLCELLDTYFGAKQVKEVYRAYLFSAEAHEGQIRKSGEPYIFHPLAAAYILAQMRMDSQTLCAALLHDVIEDTNITKEKLANEFGKSVAELVDGVSKLSSIPFETREQAQAASFQKMLLAMNRDIRVIIVKLADRLHNMRTIGAMKPASRRRIARETLEIYAPIASRLGMNAVRIELQELSFATLYPLRYRVLAQQTQKVYLKRIDKYHNIQNTIKQRLEQCQIRAQVVKREKHYYAVYEKMHEKKGAASVDKRKTFSQVTNSCALRIIVDSIDDCYRVLGVVHTLYKPICERFKDYIAIPKINGYQSLHTTLYSIHGLLIHIQIRTTAMQQIAERGITAQSIPKFDQEIDCPHEATNYITKQRTQEWLHNLLEIQQSANDSLEFLEQVKIDLFPDEVYVFTPQGKILQLPKGATAIDFAYAIHSDVGNKCIATKIDSQYAPLSTPLVSGQTVEVLTAKWARPNPSWLNFAVSARARNYIRHFLKNLQYEEAVLLGKRMLDKELANYSLSIDKLQKEQQTHLIKTFKINDLDELLAEIGLGNRMALIVANQLNPIPDSLIKLHPPTEAHKSKPLVIKGTEGILVNFARCCRPIPGDEIIGFVSVGRGIIIHTAACRHVTEYRQSPEKLLAVEWESSIEGEFLVDIRLDVHDQLGVLAIVAAAIANMESNIIQVSNESSEDISSLLKFCISVRNRVHLASVMRHLRRLETVNRIQRC
ncbi:MAG: guanosine-3',5'-bis(diphosphate) 3'-diphosphatase [Gammaproteobacteria bacterium]|nr:MAG: guanosine-3',5'-bis(diphosphate) 3'-diphosphatase [Gammaproteobacteria bacterium]RKZ74511.1 MAG: guanosine-3',5'-bis(diphosphate) 3'-diphosphatase [Gammaproteobacteria bacterium]